MEKGKNIFEEDKSKCIMICIIAFLMILLIIAFSIIISNQSHDVEKNVISNETEEIIVAEKYPVIIKIDFVPNIIFDKYNVKIKLNGEEKNLSHGENAELEFELEKGTYDIVFENFNDSSIRGVENITITGETEISYKITCFSKEIKIETLYIENKGDVNDGEALIPINSENCKFKNFKNIEKDFKDAGFTNITYSILYDIIWGWTDEGEVENVSIDGNTAFKRGDIISKDSKIVITYHMKENSNPNKTPSSNEETTKVGEESSNIVIPTNNSQNNNEAVQNQFIESQPNNDNDILTINNTPELLTILTSKNESNDMYINFAKKYKGKTIQFDGRIDNIAQHNSYKTRYDILVSYGDYIADSQTGPTFKFKDVNAFDLGLDTMYLNSILSVGTNVVIKAEVKEFDSDKYIFYLDPVEVKLR